VPAGSTTSTRSWRTWATAMGVVAGLALVGIVVATSDPGQQRRDGGVVLPDPDDVADPPSAAPRDPLGVPGRVRVSAHEAPCAEPSPDVTLDCPAWQLRTEETVHVLRWDRDEVVVGAGYQVVVLDAATGDVRWHRDLSTIIIEPALDADAVYVLDAAGMVTALDRSTGEFRWQTSVGSARFAVATAGVLITESRQGVIGLNPADGSRQWEVVTHGASSRPLVVGNRVFFGDGDGDIRAIDPSTGRIMWQTHAGGWHVAGHEGHTTVAVSGFGGQLVGLDRETTAITWEADIVVGWGYPQAMPDGRSFVVWLDEGDVHIVDASDGTSTLVAQGTAGPVVVDMQGLLYLTQADGAITAITPEGQQLWTDSWRQGIVRATGWVDGSPWLFVMDDSSRTLMGLPAIRRPPPDRLDAVPTGQPCPVTPLQDRPYRTVAAGRFTELSGTGVLPHGTYPTTFVSVTDQAREGPVTLTGRRLDAPGTMTFSPTTSDEPVAELVLTSDGLRGGGPNGTPPHWAVLLDDPEPGCWSYELQAHDGLIDQIIVHITP
jgi:outer membrane protein assembly factor BamB